MIQDLPSDLAVLAAVRASLNATERREFGYLYREARRNPGCGIRPAIKIALARMRERVTERIDRAAEKLGGR